MKLAPANLGKKALFLSVLLILPAAAFAQNQPLFSVPPLGLQVNGASSDSAQMVGALRILVVLTVLSLAPAILILMTSFTRIVIVLSFLRQAIGTGQMPPNQLIIGFSLFLTLFVMTPTLKAVYNDAVEPFVEERIEQEVAMERAAAPVKAFMLNQTREKDLTMFIKLTKSEKPQTKGDISLALLVPAFVVSELKTAFQIGFMLYLPFLVIDMVVASLLMAMGMMMLPPAIVSLPFKLLLFVLVDGWSLIVGSLIKSFV